MTCRPSSTGLTLTRTMRSMPTRMCQRPRRAPRSSGPGLSHLLLPGQAAERLLKAGDITVADGVIAQLQWWAERCRQRDGARL